ncbi:MAG: ADP-glyceromanno-heptose 6-epimerase [Planctomycetota bacterium]
MYIVTGAAGFIGSALVAALNHRRITDILIVDEPLSAEKNGNLRKLIFADYIEKDDWLERVLAAKTPDKINAIFHMGACSDTTVQDRSYLQKNNYDYSRILAEFAVERKIRFICASSAATYGDGSVGFSDDHAMLEKLVPLNLYGRSKHLFDLWAKRTGILKRIVVLKYFNVFGPNEYHKGHMRSFVIKAFQQINSAGKVRLFKSYNPEYADGRQMRDFIYVKDAVDMTLFFLDNPHPAGIFNIGTAKARSWNDLAKATFAAMGKKENIEYIDMPEVLRDRYQYFTQADITKLCSAGYSKDITSLEDAIKDYIQNYLQKNEYLSGS